jgi:hypothetical protein
VVVPHRATLGARCAAAVIAGLLRCIAFTLRRRFDPLPAALTADPSQPVIFAVWHNRLALSMAIHRFLAGRCGRDRLAALVSASRDGGLLSRVLELFGVQAVRGSSSRRGAQALLELTSWAERGYGLAITPDGPRGPRYQVQEGIIALAQLTGLPIVPVSYHLSWKHCLRSWDRFQVPLPFARWELHFGEPLRVPRAAGDVEREALRVELERRLMAITRD